MQCATQSRNPAHAPDWEPEPQEKIQYFRPRNILCRYSLSPETAGKIKSYIKKPKKVGFFQHICTRVRVLYEHNMIMQKI